MRPLLFTPPLAILLLLCLAPSTASADRVVLYPPTGANEELADHVDEALANALIALSHQATSESAVISGPIPTSGNEMRAIAEMERAQWVVVPTVEGARAMYRLHLRVGQASDGRVEELEVTVLGDGEDERLRDVLAAMLRAAGVGDDSLRLTEEPDDAAAHAAAEAARLEEEERRRAQEAQEAQEADEEDEEDEEAAREEFLARERERAEEDERRQQQGWENREQYGQRDAQWMLSLGVDVRPIVAAPAGASGGLIWGLSARLGHTFEDVDGLELRVAVDGFGGSSSGFAIAAGAVYLHSFFQFPLFIGLSLELGLFQPVTGNNSPSFMLRVAPTVAWRITDELHLEAAVAEIMYVSVGAATVGGALRFAYRF